ncbi:bacteriohemerythrin [Roseospira visakhapatnamensis]|uniref:Hemerythrin-like metal-binding protein n=1 Tax=Roseospira visakhapatnamensis TaxID=390880 RepID=A0A7W6W9A7_9PROT|nr:bacteriohemerythrin [Roseospira visakhapatnamensis]MBB4265247.1 hemerythrin-like metal-binding protein [Roseospira visakhapatnamensis]
MTVKTHKDSAQSVIAEAEKAVADLGGAHDARADRLSKLHDLFTVVEQRYQAQQQELADRDEQIRALSEANDTLTEALRALTGAAQRTAQDLAGDETDLARAVERSEALVARAFGTGGNANPTQAPDAPPVVEALGEAPGEAPGDALAERSMDGGADAGAEAVDVDDEAGGDDPGPAGPVDEPAIEAEAGLATEGDGAPVSGLDVAIEDLEMVPERGLDSPAAVPEAECDAGAMDDGIGGDDGAAFDGQDDLTFEHAGHDATGDDVAGDDADGGGDRASLDAGEGSSVQDADDDESGSEPQVADVDETGVEETGVDDAIAEPALSAAPDGADDGAGAQDAVDDPPAPTTADEMAGDDDGPTEDGSADDGPTEDPPGAGAGADDDGADGVDGAETAGGDGTDEADEPLIRWSDTWSVGAEEMDRDHRILINLVNQLPAALDKAPESAWIVGSVLNSLWDYTEYHFNREEALHKAANFPGAQDHAGRHRELKAQVREWLDRYQADPHAMQGQALLTFLKGWLMNHILGEDMRYKPYVQNNPDAQAVAAAIKVDPALVEDLGDAAILSEPVV